MPRYVVTEPHPTVVQNTYVHAGRGGAGNLFRAPATTPATGVPTEVKPAARPAVPSGRFYSGRGGAGNVHSAGVRPVLSLDEEYALTEAREKHSPFAHVGRGGAGNFFGGGVSAQQQGHEKKDRKMSVASDASGRRDSTSSSGSARSGFLQRISSHIGR